MVSCPEKKTRAGLERNRAGLMLAYSIGIKRSFKYGKLCKHILIYAN